ncbi:cGMP-dependent protein kinase, isozyme 2 forms cD5/T2-like [Rhagoletis pomonella]|uniref:cGMP-dependent protein kinase, isozyme 2 forms cD5/T2-like n=1 Tax=Rhagoletis pomonella TaxID=28610 RepID=UPI0017825FF8|nr:cGMP-dependent protein kinase, isozyme 2 forms cD5/T2-like [Rhagoletis pomonella]
MAACGCVICNTRGAAPNPLNCRIVTAHAYKLQSVRVHLHPCRWFDGFYWLGLQNRTLEPPIKPTVKSVVDTTNFDAYPPDPEGPPPDDLTGWDKDF